VTRSCGAGRGTARVGSTACSMTTPSTTAPYARIPLSTRWADTPTSG
jgi:hypothetical protein